MNSTRLFSSCFPHFAEFPQFSFSNAQRARNNAELEKSRVSHILSLAGSINFPSSIKVLKIHFPDSVEESTNLPAILEEIIEFLEPALLKKFSQPVILVHCQGGISRSPSILIGLFMWRSNFLLTADEALKLVKKENSIKIKPKFLEALENWRKQKLENFSGVKKSSSEEEEKIPGI